MLEISDQIKEGSEGFFITQYGTIFRLAFVFAA
jgi:Na+/H+-translocating membrane pyrophosphatase